MVAHLGHHDEVDRVPDPDSGRSGMVRVHIDGHDLFGHKDVLEIHEMGWYINGANGTGTVWFHPQ